MKKLTKEEFIIKSKQIHKDKYKYDLVEYINALTKVKIICKEHGEFLQLPSAHMKGHDCNKCVSDKYKTERKMSLEDFTEKCKSYYKTYDYSKVNYINAHTKVCIICPTHGEFFKSPNNHILNHKQGCPLCSPNSIGEEKIITFLTNNKIEFIKEKRFENCRDKRSLPFDFYLPCYNILIEYDGKQHFNENYNWGIDNFEKTKLHDEIKTKYANDNNIKLLRIPYWDFNKLNSILKEVLK